MRFSFRIARRKENEGKLVVAILASGGERYLSTNLFQNLWYEVSAEFLPFVLMHVPNLSCVGVEDRTQ